MDIQDMLNGVLNKAGDIVEGAKDVTDKISTAAYTKGSELKETVSDGLKNKQKLDNQVVHDAIRYDSAMNKLKNNKFEQVDENGNYVEEDIENTDPRNREELLKNYNDEQKDVYKSKTFIPEQKVGTAIKRWLETDYRDTPKNDNITVSTIEKKRGNSIDQPFRLEMGKMLLKQYGTNEIRFSDLTELFNKSEFAQISSETGRRLVTMEYVLHSYAGETSAMKNLDLECELSAKQASIFSKIIKDYLEGRLTIEKCSQDLFFAVHGVDIEQLPNEELSNNQIVNLCLIQEMGGGIDLTQFLAQSPEQITILLSAIQSGNVGFENIDFTSQYYIMGCIDKTQKNHDMECITIEKGSDAGIDLIFDYNFTTDSVDIYKHDYNSQELIATRNANGEFVKGNLYMIVDIFKQNDRLKDFISKKDFSLQSKIDKFDNNMHIEAYNNKLSAAEISAIKREEDEAIAKAVAAHGAPVGYNG